MTLSFLQQWHRYLILACEHPAPDEDVNELRRLRSKIARAIGYWHASLKPVQTPDIFGLRCT
jgi:hypothetical protein